MRSRPHPPSRRAFLLAIVVSLGAFLSGCSSGSSSSNAAEEQAIRAVLEQQVQSWNERKLEDFMNGYWRSPELTFFSGGKKTNGWDATIQRYRDRYQSSGREMGTLKFSDLDVKVLGSDSAFVRGRFDLEMSDGAKPTGIYTLVLKKFPEGWRVIHDHTSTD